MSAPRPEWGLNPLESELWTRGYQQCANNIHSIPGTLWTPKGAGLPVPKGHNRDINVRDGKLLIVRSDFHGEPYTKSAHFTQHVEAEFSTVDEMTEWLKANGRLSEPGLPPFSNSWD